MPSDGAEHPGADVSQVGHFEQALQGAVFAEGAVQDGEEHIQGGDGFEACCPRRAYSAARPGSGSSTAVESPSVRPDSSARPDVRAGDPGALAGDADLEDIVFLGVEHR